MLERFELLGLVVEGLEEGLAAGWLEGREAFMEERPIWPLEARCPIRWASISRGAMKINKRVSSAMLSRELELFSIGQKLRIIAWA
jgi:hypothetical protein